MKKIFFILAVSMLLVFTGFSYLVKHEFMKTADFAFTVKLQEAIDRSPRLRLSRFVGEIMEGSTFFASPEVSVVAVLCITGFAVYDRKRKKIRWVALIIPLCFFLLVLGEIYGKTVVHHPAPPFFMIKNPTSIFPKYYINDQFSYPSGHAARAMFLAVISSYFVLRISFFRRKYLKVGGLIFLFFYIVLVSISRIYLGHHWVSDILGGLLLGGGLGFLTMYVFLVTDG